jgi:Transposase IS116/IS110/IS902 family
MLSGTAPVPVSSGRTGRHRLNRPGDRQLNRALHTMAVSRMRSHPPTLAYIQRRRAEGKTDREIRRCIKRYLARHLYRALSAGTCPSPRRPDKHRSVRSTLACALPPGRGEHLSYGLSDRLVPLPRSLTGNSEQPGACCDSRSLVRD